MKEKIFNGRRKFLVGAVSLAVGSLFFGVKAQNANGKKIVSNSAAKKIPPANARLGINFAGLADWSSEQPFVDFFHLSRDWVSQKRSGGWGTGPELALDEHGWIKKLEAGCFATRAICTAGVNQYPSGQYVLLYDGEGDVRLTHDVGRILEKTKGKMLIDINASKGDFFIDLVSTNPDNYMRNIRIIAPGFEKTYQTNPWHPEFLKRWAGVACIRLMDFMATNNSDLTTWAKRPQLNDASFMSKGTPVELLVDLANRMQTDVWFCMPHQADDDYVKQFASYVKAHLDPALTVWVEYSNELWNGIFEQSRYASEQGQTLKLADKPWEAAWKFTAYRSKQIFAIWSEVYGSTDKLVRVLASQAASSYVSEQILSFENVAESADALAIAPYVSFNVPEKSDDGLDASVVSKWNIDQLFKHLNQVALPESAKWIQDSKKVADAYGLKLVAYESGQHLVGIGGGENNDKVTDLLLAANADARMGEIYTKNLSTWEQAGGDLICSYNSVNEWSKWGSWGLLRHYKQSPKSSPKFMAVVKWAASRGQKMAY